MALVMRLLELFQGGTMRKYNFLFFFFLRFCFLEQCQASNRIERRVQRFPICPLPPHALPTPLSALLTRWYIIISAEDESALTHCHPCNVFGLHQD